MELDGKNVLPVLYAAKEYQLTALVSKCEIYLRQNLHCQNACTIYHYTKKYRLETLKSETEDFIAKNASVVFNANDFLSIPSDIMIDLLKIDSLRIPEIEIFRSVLKWLMIIGWIGRLEYTATT